jgi:A/G-specific adenine glycosylase
VLLRRRPENGLLGGMMEVPSTEWRAHDWTFAEARRLAPSAARWRRLPGVVRHTFTHFHLELTVLAGRSEAVGAAGVWCPPSRLGDHALPTLMKKVARLAAYSS